MARFYSFFHLPWSDRWLLTETGLCLGLARLAVLTVPFRWIIQVLGQTLHPTRPIDAASALIQLRRVKWAVQIASRHTPWTSNCLAQALAGMLLLRRRQIASTLYLGVMKGNLALVAHAWLRSNDITVTGGQELERYTVIATFCTGQNPSQETT